MLLRRFYDEKLAQASYLVGCSATGEAMVVDPNRRVDAYLRTAELEGLRITHVTETHIHADFVSGARELARCSGGKLLLSDEGDADWKYAFAAEEGATLLRDGDVFRVGNVRVEIQHTPGHTPEHICFMITDTAAADRPMGVFTGDFVFVGDVGRPDLLERAARVEGTMEKAAKQLFASIQRFKGEPDYLQLWPGHGAGSACGKALGAVPQSTLGYERMFNWAFRVEAADDFVAAVLAGQPDPPKYFAEMKRINKEGPSIIGGFRRPERLPESRLTDLIADGAFVIDTRHVGDYAEGHVPGTINIPLDQSFPTWAGWLIPFDRDFYLIVDENVAPHMIDEASSDLLLIGLDRIAGYFGGAAVNAWAEAGRPLGTTSEITSRELAKMLENGRVAVVDVRSLSEWEAAHLPGVPNVPLGYLSDRIDEIPKDRTVVLHCQTGWRSAIAASLLKAHGYERVANLKGGIRSWVIEGHPVERG